VDGVGGVVTMAPGELAANPSTLEARSAALFDGVYKMETGLMVRLDPQRLRPLKLARSGLFGAVKQDRAKQDRAEQFRTMEMK